MPFDPSTDISEKAFWFRAKNASTGAATTLTDESGLSHNATGSGGTITASSTPSGGKALVGTNMGYTPNNVGMPHSATLLPVASSQLSGYPAERAVDGNSATDMPWVATSPTGTLRVEQRSGTPIVATSYQITGRAGAVTNQNPKTWTFQGSMDGSSWTTLDTQTNITSWTSLETKSFSFSNSTAWVYYRVNITANNGDLSNVAIVELKLNSVSNSALGGELWVVLKSNGGSGPQSWSYGTSASASHFTYGGDVYDDTGSTVRRNFTPSVSVSSWRLYRVVVNGTNWTAYLDNASQLTTSSATASWRGDAKVLDTFSGQVAEILLIGKALTSGEAADLITYFNTEHGLSVPGGSTTPQSFTGVPSRIVATAPKGTFSNATPTPRAFTGLPAGIIASAPAGAFSAGVVTPPQTFDGSPVGLVVTAPKGNYNSGASTFKGLPARLILSSRAGSYFTSGLDGEADSYTVAWATADAPIDLSGKLITADSHTDAWATAASPVPYWPEPLDSHTLAWADAVADLNVTVDPITGRPQYSLKVVETNGDVITELSDATLGVATRALNGRGGMSFALGAEDDQQQHVPQFSELQLWRGGRMVRGAWFVVPDPDDQIDADVTGFDCLGLSYYFERRLIGKERPELLKNGGFEQGARYWNFGYEAGSNAEAPPRWEITDEACEGGKALRLFAQDKVVTVKAVAETAAIFYGNRPYASEALAAGFQPGGEQKIRDLLSQANPPKNATITVEGHTADADGGTGFALSLRRANAAKAVILAARPDLTVNTVGKGETEPVDPRHNETAYRKNRRVVIKGSFTLTKVGHRQYSWQSFEYTVDPSNREPVEFDVQVQGRIDQFDGPSKDGWMLYTDVRPVAHPTKVNNDDYVDIDETSPRGVWIGLHGLPKAPADGNTYKVTLRLYPTAGATSFDQASVMPNLKLHFWQKDPFDIIGGLVAHAQDPAYGKSNLNIGIHGARSGFLLDRPYAWKDHVKVSDAIDEIVRSDNGPDANIEVSARIRRLTVAPKQGRRTGITLATDGHVGDATIVAFSAAVDGDDVTTTAFVQSSWSGGGMTEVVERLPRPDGLVLESLFQAEQDAPTSTVRQQARTAVRYGRADVVTRVVMSNTDTTMLMEQLTIGDVVWIEAHNARVNASGWYRIIQMDLDPNNDQLAFDVAPEV